MPKRSLGLVPLSIAFFLGACGDDDRPPPPTDAGHMDAGQADAGQADAGQPDAGMTDGGPWACEMSCGPTEMCCPVGVSGQCVERADECALPDLIVDADRAAESAQVDWQYFEPDDCAIAEGCVAAPGYRRLLHFETFTPNIGTADMTLGRPRADNPAFEYSPCHEHFHFNGYADYRLYDAEDNEIGTGHKQAFCLLDSERYDTTAPTVADRPRYTCSNQGIQRGWGDSYYVGLDCQWVDVTDVEPGDYTLQIALNGERTLAELDYDNNIARVSVTIPPDDPTADPTEACSRTRASPWRDCGWEVVGTYTCTAGDSLRAGCGTGCGLATECTEDPMIRICDGDAPCLGRFALAIDDDSCGDLCPPDDDSCGRYCPVATFTCPESGQYTVMTAPYSSDDTMTCVVKTEIVP